MKIEYKNIIIRNAEKNDAWTDQLGEPQSAVDYELTQELFIEYK